MYCAVGETHRKQVDGTRAAILTEEEGVHGAASDLEGNDPGEVRCKPTRKPEDDKRVALQAEDVVKEN